MGTTFPEPPEEQWPPRDTEPLRGLSKSYRRELTNPYSKTWNSDTFSTEAFPASEYRRQVSKDISALSDTAQAKTHRQLDSIDKQLQLLCIVSILLLIATIVIGIFLYRAIGGATILVPKP